MSESRADDVVSLLDIAVFLAENWITLLFGPLLIAVATYLWFSAKPTVYTAAAVVDVATLDLGKDSAEAYLSSFYRGAAKPRLGVEVRKIGPNAEITATSGSQEDATNLVRKTYAELTAALHEVISQRLDSVNTIIAQIEPLEIVLRSHPDENVASLVALARMQEQMYPYRLEAINLERALNALADGPEIDLSENRRSAIAPAALSAFSTGLVLLAALGAKAMLLAASSTEDGARKIARIKSALFLRRRLSTSDSSEQY